MAGKQTINFETVANPELLVLILNALDTEIDAIRTLVNELRTDHATQKTSHDAVETLIEELYDDHATFKTVVDEHTATFNELITQLFPNEVVYSGSPGNGAGLAIKAGGNADAKSANGIAVRYAGAIIPVAATDPIDISELTAGGDTIAQDKHGVLAVFAKTDKSIDVESVKATADYTSLLDALADYCHSSNIATYLGANEAVCIGFIHVEEDNSGAFTWGTGVLDGETANNYYDCEEQPRIVSTLASLAADGSASTFTYGAGVVVLGDGSRIALTGEVNKASEVGSAIAASKVGAWVIYALADDTVISKQLGNAYATKAAADAAVRDMVPHPYLPIIGYFTVENGTESAWTMGTDNFDDTDITTTMNKVGPGSDHVEIGRAALSQVNQVIQNAAPEGLAASKPASGPGSLSASAVTEQVSRGK